MAAAIHIRTVSARRGLIGYRAAAAPDRTLSCHLLGAGNAMCRAHEAMRRYACDPRWGRVTGNPEAAPHLASARLHLRMARDHLRRRAEEVVTAAGSAPS